MSRPMILTFNLSDARLAKLRFLCMKLGVAVKAVPQADAGQRIAALCGLAEPEEAPAAETFQEEMIVFCHMDHTLVNRILQTAKQLRFAPVALKAVLTPTNADWTAQRLHGELKQERAAVLQGGRTEHDA